MFVGNKTSNMHEQEELHVSVEPLSEKVSLCLAKRANSNLTIGNHTIQTNKIDIRSSVTIGSHVIIGAGTEIITTSHNIDSPDWTLKNYGITIEDYVWIPTNVLILPSCRNISYGSVIGSGSVVVKNTDPMSVVGGNPAKESENAYTPI